MSRAIFPYADAVVSKDADNRQAHESFHTQTSFHVIAEYEETSDIRSYAAVYCHTVCHSCHGKFTDTEMYVGASGVFFAVIFSVFHHRFIGRSQVSAAAEQVRNYFCYFLQYFFGSCTSSDVPFVFPEIFVIQQICCQLIAVPQFIFFCQFGVCFCVCCKHFVPSRFFLSAFCCPCCHVRFDFFGNEERFFIVPAQIFFCQLNFFFPQRFAVGGCFALFVGCAETDECVYFNQGRLVCFLRCRNGCCDSVYIVAVCYFRNIPAVSFETFHYIFCECNVCAAFDGDFVAVIDYDQFGQTHCASQRSCFGSNAFLKTAVAAQCVCVVVNHFVFRCVEFCCQMAFSQCHTNGVCDTLTQRACCGFYTYGVFVFRVTGCQGISLTEVLQIFNGQTIAEYMQQGIQQRGAVTCGQYKTVSVVPFGICGVCFHFLCPQCISSGGSAQRQTGMAAFCFLDGFCGKETQGVYSQVINIHIVFLPFRKLPFQKRAIFIKTYFGSRYKKMFLISWVRFPSLSGNVRYRCLSEGVLPSGSVHCKGWLRCGSQLLQRRSHAEGYGWKQR